MNNTFDPSDPQSIARAFQSLSAQITALNERNTALAANIANQPKPNAKEPKVLFPSGFDGDRLKGNDFFTQVELAFALMPTRYPSHEIQIKTVGTLLKGDALSWFTPLVEKAADHQPTLASWAAFKTAFLATFGTINAEETASKRLLQLTQGNGSAATYVSSFRHFSSRLTDWGENPLRFIFIQGLSPEIRSLLIGKPKSEKDTLQKAQDLSIEIDNELTDNRKNHPNHPRPKPAFRPVPHSFAAAPRPAPAAVPHVPHFPPAPDVASAPVPMEIDALARRGPLTPAERSHRMTNGLCIICGSSGHLAAACPKRRISSATFAAAAAAVTTLGPATVTRAPDF